MGLYPGVLKTGGWGGGGAFDVGFYGNYYLKCTVRSKCMPEDKTLWERVFGRGRTKGMVL